jgi:hypothetical protein
MFSFSWDDLKRHLFETHLGVVAPNIDEDLNQDQPIINHHDDDIIQDSIKIEPDNLEEESEEDLNQNPITNKDQPIINQDPITNKDQPIIIDNDDDIFQDNLEEESVTSRTTLTLTHPGDTLSQEEDPVTLGDPSPEVNSEHFQQQPIIGRSFTLDGCSSSPNNPVTSEHVDSIIKPKAPVLFGDPSPEVSSEHEQPIIGRSFTLDGCSSSPNNPVTSTQVNSLPKVPSGSLTLEHLGDTLLQEGPVTSKHFSPEGMTCLLEHVKIEPEVSVSENTTHGNNSLIQTSGLDYSSAVPKEEQSCSSAINSLIQTSGPDYSSAVPKEEESCSSAVNSLIQTSDHDYSFPVLKDESCLTVNSLMIQSSSSDHDYSWTLPKPESCSTVINSLSGAKQVDSSSAPKEESCLTVNSLMMIQSSSSDHDYSWTLPKPESCSTVINNTLTGAQQVDSLNEEQTEKTRQTKYSEKGNVSRMSEPEKTFQVNHSVIRLD